MRQADLSEPSSAARHLELGRRGEDLAVDYLAGAGYRIVGANFSLPVGRNTRGLTVKAEIDIVAYDGPTLCFVEVKTRASDEIAPPERNVNLRKQRQIARAARAYRRTFDLMEIPHRYDVVTIVLPAANPEQSAAAARVELLKNFWTDAVLRQRRWSDAWYD
jgi:putative endonuclease